MHVPDATIVTDVPDTVHTAVVDDVTVGESPDVADTVTVNVDADHVLVPGSVNEIVFVPLATVIDCVADVRPVAEKVIVTEPGVALSPRPLNVATPDDAVAVLDPTSEPLDALAVMTVEAEVTLLPPESRTSITGCVVNALP